MKSKISNIFNRFDSKKDNNQAGTTAVEFALILPWLIAILFGIFQFGIAFNNWITLTHAASEGARLASVGDYLDLNDLEQKVKDRVPSNIIEDVAVTGNDGEIGDPVKVIVTGKVLKIIIPFVKSWDISLKSTAFMRLETSKHL